MNDYFDRQYRLKASAPGYSGFEVGQPDEETSRALHIKFSIEKTDGSTLNTTKMQLWNLNKTQIATLAKEGCTVELYAGYGESRPCVFKGTVSLVTEELDGSDRLIEFEVVDGFAEVNDTYVSLSYRGNIEVKRIIEDITNQLGMPVVFSEKARQRLLYVYYTNGYAYVGKATKALTQLCTKASLRYTIQNGIVQITKVSEPVSNIVHKLSKETGLIGIPKKLYNSSVSSINSDTSESGTEATLYGYEVVFFLNGAIGINDTVYLESSIVTGNFRVSTLKIEGDNLTSDWQCTAELVEIGG